LFDLANVPRFRQPDCRQTPTGVRRRLTPHKNCPRRCSASDLAKYFLLQVTPGPEDVFAGVDLSLRSTAARFFSNNKKRSFALGCKAVPITLFIARAISRVTYQVLYLSSDTGGIIPKVHQVNNFNHQYGMAAVNMSTNKERK